MRPHVTLGHIGGNDLPRQGQRQHLQNLRQRNYSSSGSTEISGDFPFGVLLLGLLCFLLSCPILLFLIHWPSFGKLVNGYVVIVVAK